MNHRWDNNNMCVQCGISRKKHTLVTILAIMNYPPWEVRKSQRVWVYSWRKTTWYYRRPNCPNHKIVIDEFIKD